MFNWIFSKIGAIGAAIVAFVGLFLWGKHQQAKRQQAEAEKVAAESRAEVAETIVEVKAEEEQRHEKVDESDPDELIDYWRGKPE